MDTPGISRKKKLDAQDQSTRLGGAESAVHAIHDRLTETASTITTHERRYTDLIAELQDAMAVPQAQAKVPPAAHKVPPAAHQEGEARHAVLRENADALRTRLDDLFQQAELTLLEIERIKAEARTILDF